MYKNMDIQVEQIAFRAKHMIIPKKQVSVPWLKQVSKTIWTSAPKTAKKQKSRNMASKMLLTKLSLENAAAGTSVRTTQWHISAIAV